MNPFRDLAAAVDAVAPPMHVQIARTVRRLEAQADQIRHDALVSGAMPGDFRVVHVFRRRPWPVSHMGTELR